jgi:hypothetical protein
MASTGTAAGQYKNILTSEGMNVKNRLNEIALDPSLNAVEKAAAYTKAVDEYNVLASTYAGDQEKLVNLQGIVRAGNYSNTIERDSEEFGIARALGLGEYKIIKDGYLVNGKKITSAELDKYVGLYKPKNIEAFAKLDSELRSSIRDAKGDKSREESILNEALNIPVEQKLNYLVDYKDQVYSGFVDKNNKLNEDAINLVYGEVLKKLREDSSVEPLISSKAVDPSSHQGRANRYVESAQTLEGLEGLLNETLPGAWQRNGNIISFYAGNTEDGQPLYDSQLADVSTPEGIKAVLKLAATQEYSAANAAKMSDYIRQKEIMGYDFSVNQSSSEGGNNSNEKNVIGIGAEEYPENIMNASDEPIVYNEKTDGSKGDFERSIYKKYNMNDEDQRNYLIEYGNTFTEKNFLKYKFDKTGREEYNTNLANAKNEMTKKVALLQDYYNNSQEIANTNNYKVDEVRKIFNKIGKTWNGTKNFTKKDLALVNYIKAGNKYEDLEQDLALTFKDIEI